MPQLCSLFTYALRDTSCNHTDGVIEHFFILSCKTNGKVDVMSSSLITFAEAFTFSGYFTTGGTIRMNATSWAKAHNQDFFVSLCDLASLGLSQYYSASSPDEPGAYKQKYKMSVSGSLLFCLDSEMDIRKPQQPLAWGAAVAAMLFSFRLCVLCLPINIY